MQEGHVPRDGLQKLGFYLRSAKRSTGITKQAVPRNIVTELINNLDCDLIIVGGSCSEVGDFFTSQVAEVSRVFFNFANDFGYRTGPPDFVL